MLRRYHPREPDTPSDDPDAPNDAPQATKPAGRSRTSKTAKGE